MDARSYFDPNNDSYYSLFCYHLHTVDIFCSYGHTFQGVFVECQCGAGTPHPVLCDSRISAISKQTR